MSRVKIPGVYMIRNTINGKVYIGSTGNIRDRWKVHRWTATSDNISENMAARPIVAAMRKHGLKNFEFSIIESGDSLSDLNTRLLYETECIAKYNSDDPEYGYNFRPGFAKEREHFKREYKLRHTPQEIYSRSKAIIEYNIKTRHMILYPGGANAWGKHRGYGKDVASHTVNRGTIIAGKYYLVYANKQLRHDQLDKIRKSKSNPDKSKRAQSKVSNNLNAYSKVINYIDSYW